MQVHLRRLLSSAVLVVSVAVPVAAAEAPADSTFPEKRSAREPWEYVVSFPGDVVDLVLDVPFAAIEASVAFVYRRHLIQRTVDLLTADDGSWAVVPVVTARFEGGAKYYHRNIFTEGSKFTVHAVAGTHNRQSYGLELKRLALFDGVRGGVDLDYDFMPDQEFFGLGPVTGVDDETNYSHERARAAFHTGWGRRRAGDVYAGVLAAIEHNNVLDGRGDDTPNTLERYDGLAGAGEQVRMGSFGVETALDTRDFPGSPTGGWMATSAAEVYTEVDGDTYGFYKFRADAETYLHIAYHRVVALRVAGEFTTRHGDRAIPFYYLSSLGRYETIRGFSNGRFRDSNAVLASLEYRWPVRHGADATLFVDAGTVYDNPDDFRTGNIAVGWGGGFRVFNRRDVIATLQAGKSKDEWRFYFVLNQ